MLPLARAGKRVGENRLSGEGSEAEWHWVQALDLPPLPMPFRVAIIKTVGLAYSTQTTRAIIDRMSEADRALMHECRTAGEDKAAAAIMQSYIERYPEIRSNVIRDITSWVAAATEAIPQWMRQRLDSGEADF